MLCKEIDFFSIELIIYISRLLIFETGSEGSFNIGNKMNGSLFVNTNLSLSLHTFIFFPSTLQTSHHILEKIIPGSKE